MLRCVQNIASSSFRHVRRPLFARELHLSPRERDHLELHQAGRCAQYRLARGVKLNYTESVALISMQMMERIRDGTKSVAELMTLGKSVLGRSQVVAGIRELLSSVQICLLYTSDAADDLTRVDHRERETLHNTNKTKANCGSDVLRYRNKAQQQQQTTSR